MPMFQAIAAMSENRVIGNHGKLPWHLPEEYRWFKHKTMGGTLVMGRITYESIGKPLPGRDTVVLTRKAQEHSGGPGFIPYPSFVKYVQKNSTSTYWICGGTQIYQQMLNVCSLLYLSRVKGVVEGDAEMPSFEDQFTQDQIIHTTDKFQVERWKKKNLSDLVMPPEQWPNLLERTPVTSTQQPPKLSYCLYLPDDWKKL